MNINVQAAIDGTIERLASARFEIDPLLPLAVSQACSVAESAKKRHGKIIEIALLEGLKQLSRYEVWAPARFRIPEQADQIASLLADGAKLDGAASHYSGRGRDVQIDMLAYDRENRILRSYEVKRGHGRHDAGKVRSMQRDLRCVQAVLGSFGSASGMEVRLAEARILFWYGRRSLPKPWSLTGLEIDAHFGCAVSKFVEEATALFGARVLALINGDSNPYPQQPAFALEGGSKCPTVR
jgi:hypothetical protein